MGDGRGAEIGNWFIYLSEWCLVDVLVSVSIHLTCSYSVLAVHWLHAISKIESTQRTSECCTHRKGSSLSQVAHWGTILSQDLSGEWFERDGDFLWHSCIRKKREVVREWASTAGEATWEGPGASTRMLTGTEPTSGGRCMTSATSKQEW